jgi:fructose-1,6-bisphosphatase/inositol monophosphatase family enzyme
MTSATSPAAVSGRPALEVAREAAVAAGTRILERFRRPQEVGTKGRGNLVTATDLEAEKIVHDALAREFPGHAILSEESATETDISGWAWVLDPLDGTRNFVSGIPFFCVNLALCYDRQPVVAVTHDPNHGETFWAERGKGAWVNSRRICASTQETVQASVLAIDLGYDDERGRGLLGLVHQLFPGVQSVRIPGSAALGLAYAGSGRYDLFVHHYMYPWDIAAGILLVREAGGVVTDHTGAEIDITSRTIVAGGPAVHADFLRWQRERNASLHLPPNL